MHYALENYHSRVYHFIIGIVLSSTVLILVPNHGIAKVFIMLILLSLPFVTAVLLGLGTWLGAWMNQLEEKYK